MYVTSTVRCFTTVLRSNLCKNKYIFQLLIYFLLIDSLKYHTNFYKIEKETHRKNALRKEKLRDYYVIRDDLS